MAAETPAGSGLEALYRELAPLLLRLLTDHRDGMSEFSLLERLAEQGLAAFGRETRSDALCLFQSHFVLFHLLYRLRDRLRAEGAGELRIDCLCIRLDPLQPGGGDGLPAIPDPLGAYYLEPENLRTTGAEEVEALLAAFWGRYCSFDRRADALLVLGLSDPVADEEIRRAYRRLAMEHHPDRGGDTARLQAINAAMEVLKAGRG